MQGEGVAPCGCPSRPIIASPIMTALEKRREDEDAHKGLHPRPYTDASAIRVAQFISIRLLVVYLVAYWGGGSAPGLVAYLPRKRAFRLSHALLSI